MLFHRILIGSRSSEDIDEVHLIRSLPRDWACLVQIESGVRTLRERFKDIPPYALVHDRDWRMAESQSETLVKRAKKFSYDSLAEFVDQHLYAMFHDHALRVLAPAWSPVLPALRAPTRAGKREPSARATRRKTRAAAETPALA